MRRWIRLIGGPNTFFAMAVALVGLAGLGDYATGNDLAFTLFYLAPVALAAWCSGRATGLFVATLSAAAWFVVDCHRAVPMSMAVRLTNLATELGVFGTVSWLLSSLKERLDLESDRGKTDSLTGLKNRRAFDDAAAGEVERARRHNHPFTVAFVDLDDFKLVNDSMGHEAGDQVLVGVADVFRRRLRAVDLAARLGGDEFALLLPETNAEQAATLLQSLLDQFVHRFEVLALPVGLSVGSVTFQTPPPDLEDALRQADKLMYEAKRSGKGRLIHKTCP